MHHPFERRVFRSRIGRFWATIQNPILLWDLDLSARAVMRDRCVGRLLPVTKSLDRFRERPLPRSQRKKEGSSVAGHDPFKMLQRHYNIQSEGPALQP